MEVMYWRTVTNSIAFSQALQQGELFYVHGIMSFRESFLIKHQAWEPH